MKDKLGTITKFYKIPNKDILKILEVLSKEYSIETQPIYEYSVGQKKTNFKLLHLLFYEELDKNKKDQLFNERKKQIESLFNLFNNKFNLILLNKLLVFADNPDYPLQISFEFNRHGLEKIKLYFSNVKRLENNLGGSIDLIRNILTILSIPNKIKNNQILGEGIDCIGIDFHKNSDVQLKIYSYYHKKFDIEKIKSTIISEFDKYETKKLQLSQFFQKISDTPYMDWGFLYRISAEGELNSVKCWFRLDPKTNVQHNGYKISYLAFDKNGLGIYFRENERIENDDYFFKELTEKIAATDFTGYTIQYPPMFLWENAGVVNKLHDWQEVSARDKPGIYIHIPFCDQKCSFCRYFSKKKDNEDLDLFINYLKKEIDLYSKYFKDKKIYSLYIGGGTPSVLSSVQLTNLFKLVNSNFNFVENMQRCIEVNPSNITLEKLQTLKELGINRLTIGVQTITSEVLQTIGRKQTKEQVISTIQLAKKVGFENINIDLMVGLPGESMDSFEKTIRQVISLNPDMIHLHPFYPTPYTEFMKKGYRLSAKDFEIREKMSEVGNSLLIKHGFKGIKFDANGKNESARNIQLSDAIDYISSYIGFGPGAISHLKGRWRYVNFEDIWKYYDHLDKGRLPIMKLKTLSIKEEMIYYITSCLRYGNVSKNNFYKMFNQDILVVFRGAIHHLKERDIITEDENNLFLNSKNIGEYLIYSKYFYDKQTIDKSKKIMGFKCTNKLVQEDINHMCL